MYLKYKVLRSSRLRSSILQDKLEDIGKIKTFEKNGKLFYKIKVLRNSRLRTSIIQNQISEIGKIKEVVKQVNLNADRKRLWLGRIESIESKTMNESVPISMIYFKKELI